MEQAISAILLFAGASFFFALAETALFSLSKWQVAQLASQHPHRGKIVARLLERPHDLLATLVLGNTFANAAMLKKAEQQSASSSKLTDAEYHELLEMAFHQGALAETEKEIILQIISLDQRVARDVMRPRACMACVNDEAPMAEMITAAKKYRYRRLPIYDETPDTIVGILNTRALLLNPENDLGEAVEFPSFVPETMNLLHLFRALQKQQRGLAVVLDEFGGTAGVVTMEDILGQIVGQIRSQTHPEGFVMEKITPYRWRLNGTMRLEDFRREFPALPEMAGVETMGGLLAHLLGVVPDAGESAVFSGLKLTAQVSDGRRVNELLVQRIK